MKGSRFPGLAKIEERRRQLVADLVARRRELGLSQAEIAARMATSLDATGDEPIDVVVDSGEGTLEAAFVLIDVIEAARAPVRVRCRVEGPAIGVVALGDERVATPRATFRLIAPTVAASGSPDRLAA